jgi:hypothetical protein
LHTVIKVKKKIFCHFFTDNFFRMISLQFFQRIRNQQNLAKKKVGLVILAHFVNFESKRERNIYCKCVLKLNFATINGL